MRYAKNNTFKICFAFVFRLRKLFNPTTRSQTRSEALEIFKHLLYEYFSLRGRIKLELSCCYKVNRCLARYSPRATTTNRPTNRAWPKLTKNANFGPNLVILGQKNPFFYWRNQKFCCPHNGKPT